MRSRTRAGARGPRATAVFAALATLLSLLPVFFAPLPAQGVDDPSSFQVGSNEPDTGSLAGLIESTTAADDWRDLTLDTGGNFVPGEVAVANDTGYTGPEEVIDPATAAQVTAYCPHVSDDDIIAGGTKIDDYPFQEVSGSVPGKVDLCQVYVSYGFQEIGGETHTIAFIGALRREVGGTTAVAVELNRVSHSQRAEGDLLVTFEFDGNGPVSVINTRLWDESASAWGAPVANSASGSSWEHFGEIRVDLSASNLLPEPQSADDCFGFSSVAPYGFRGNSDSSQVGDWLEPLPIEIPRCGILNIVKDATPPSGDLEFDWRIADGDQGFADITGKIKDGETVKKELVNGTYSLTEDTPPSPYALDRIECTGGVDPADIEIEVGTNVTCTIYNESSAVQVVKAGDGDDTALFDFSLTGQEDFQLALGNQSDTYLYLPGSSITVSETLPADSPPWTLDSISCVGSESGDISPEVDLGEGTASFDTLAGELITCTYTNSQDAILTLVKDLQNNYGGDAQLSDFELTATGPTTISGTTGEPEVTSALVPPGSYDLSESTSLGGYTRVGDWTCLGGDQTDGDTVALAAGDVATCTITNEDLPPELIVVKEVQNNHNGSASPGDFQLKVNGSAVDQGTAIPGIVSNTSYTVTEDQLPGYTQVGDVSCVDNDTQGAVSHPVVLDEGQSVTCTITNEDQPASITVIKDFAHETSVSPDDFKLTLNDDPVVSGESNELPAATYTVAETLLDGWTQVGDIACEDADGPVAHPVVLGIGQHVTCTIVNAELPTIEIVKVVIGDDAATFGFSGDAPFDDFSFDENGGSKLETVEPGQYVVTETQAEFWSLTDLTCEGGAEGDMNSLTSSFDVDYGDHQKCTYTNERLPESVEVVTEGVCIGHSAWLKWTINPVNFNATDTTITWLDIDPGDPLYQQTSQPLQGMMLWPGTLEDGGETIDWPGYLYVDPDTKTELPLGTPGGVWVAGSDGYENTRPTTSIKFSVNPDVVVQETYAGGDPLCDPPGQIWVEKEVIDGALDFPFTFNTVNFTLDDNTLAHGEVGMSGPLEPGDGYSVSEVVPEGWEDPVVSCDDGSDPTNIDVGVAETVTCTFQNTIEPLVLALVELEVKGSCTLVGDQEVGAIHVSFLTDNPDNLDPATVVIKDGNTIIGTLTADGSIPADVGKSYDWSATANEANGFTFAPDFDPEGVVAVGRCNLPFTGVFAEDLALLALGLTLAGIIAVVAARRSRDEGLDR